ncbi:MAG: hypothetical protein AB8F78_00215 [Saprospiraceae bacterium]
MKTSVVLGRVVKVAAVVVITATITWQSRTEHQVKGGEDRDILTQQAGLVPQPWVDYRKEQVHSMPNRFALSKAYYGTENALLEAAELERLRDQSELIVDEPKS